MMKKRGQVTVFIILGIIILLLVVTVISLKSFMTTQQAKVEEEKALQAAFAGESIKVYVESCLERTTRNAILENSFSGGYFILPEKSTTDLFDNVPYYFQNEEDLSPSDELIANEVAKYVDGMLNLCLNDFKTFKEQGYEVIIKEKPVSEATLSPSKLSIKTQFPITLTIGTITKDIDNFAVNVPAIDFYQNILTAREIIKNQEKGEICITCFSNLALENELLIYIFPSADNTYVFDIKDDNYVLSNENFRLRFALQYDETE